LTACIKTITPTLQNQSPMKQRHMNYVAGGTVKYTINRSHHTAFSKKMALYHPLFCKTVFKEAILSAADQQLQMKIDIMKLN